MMKFIACAILSLTVLMLSSCVHRMPPAVAACKMSCVKRAQVCNKLCHNNCKRCIIGSCRKANSHYQRYRHEQCLKGGIIARNVNSYRDPLKCRKVTCNCRADFSICVQSCTGAIKKRLQAPPLC